MKKINDLITSWMKDYFFTFFTNYVTNNLFLNINLNVIAITCINPLQ